MAQRAAHASTTPSTKEQTLQDTFKGLIIEDQWRFEGDTDKFHTFRTMIEAIANRYPIMAALLRNATAPTHTDMAAILRLDDAHYVATITAQFRARQRTFHEGCRAVSLATNDPHYGTAYYAGIWTPGYDTRTSVTLSLIHI